MGSGLGVLFVRRRTGSGVVLPRSIRAPLFALMESLHPEAWEAPSQGLLMECWYWRWTERDLEVWVWYTVSAPAFSTRPERVCPGVCNQPRVHSFQQLLACAVQSPPRRDFGVQLCSMDHGSLFGVRRALPPLKSLQVPLHRMGMVWWMHLAGGGIVLMPTMLWWGVFLNDNGTVSSWLGQDWLQ